MALVEYTLDENVAILSMNSGENRFNYPFAKSLNQGRDIIHEIVLFKFKAKRGSKFDDTQRNHQGKSTGTRV